MFERRVSLIVGAFGSGKTEVAVNAALAISRRGEAVTLVDLDVVKPYFRSRSLHRELARHGIPVTAPPGEHPFPEVPIALAQVAGLLLPGRPKVIVDVGGDPVGSLAIGALSAELPSVEVEHLLVLNFARPQTGTVEQAVAMARAIQGAARLPLTGLVANTNLLGETTPELVLDGLRCAARTGAVLGLPLALAAVEERLLGALPPGWAPCPVLPMRRMVFPPFETPASLPGGAGRAGALAAARPLGQPPARPGG
ncbi:MAG: hypothetical protein ACE147_09760 [Candidatus Methylomirabilales bacterium]